MNGIWQTVASVTLYCTESELPRQDVVSNHRRVALGGSSDEITVCRGNCKIAPAR
jgi:hypothetical protein